MKTLMLYIYNAFLYKNGLLLTNSRFFISYSQEFDLGADFKLGEIGVQIHSNGPALKIYWGNTFTSF